MRGWIRDRFRLARAWVSEVAPSAEDKFALGLLVVLGSAATGMGIAGAVAIAGLVSGWEMVTLVACSFALLWSFGVLWMWKGFRERRGEG